MTKAWLITGGSSGLGLSLGRAVLGKGITAVLTTRSIVQAQQAAPDIEEKGGKWLQLDFADPNLEQLVRDAVLRWDVDVIVNNAGYPMTGPVEESRYAQPPWPISCAPLTKAVQLSGYSHPAVIPTFRERKSGTIANIGSSVSYTGVPGIALYASTKAALRSVTQGLAIELASFGIRVLLFEPGRFRTNFGSGAIPAEPGEPYKDTPVQHLLNMLKNAPPAPGNPDEAALRMYEIVTKTGLADNEALEDCMRFPLGKDANDGVADAGKEWSHVAEVTAAISRSTDYGT
ncbi:hypothetical protein FH972_022118 [Carpinus fangiana]|uniref:Uncharacterized protein n=1 Tax=Carpinus fangiana TaxID=176857 RepID=A0A5N6KRU8_9ROSI|nr:hypothetical protein FH972_022118 [Carpinus fangiana]